MTAVSHPFPYSEKLPSILPSRGDFGFLLHTKNTSFINMIMLPVQPLFQGPRCGIRLLLGTCGVYNQYPSAMLGPQSKAAGTVLHRASWWQLSGTGNHLPLSPHSFSLYM